MTMVTPPTVEVRRHSRVVHSVPSSPLPHPPSPLPYSSVASRPASYRSEWRSSSSSLGFIGSDPSSRCSPRSQHEDEEMLVPAQEVAAADTDAAQPMEGTVRSYLILLLCFSWICSLVWQCATLGTWFFVLALS